MPLSLVVGGLESKPGQPGTYSDWCRERLEVGDEISIRIAESDERDDPVEERMDPPEEIVLQEKKKYVRRICEELGWEIIEPKD